MCFARAGQFIGLMLLVCMVGCSGGDATPAGDSGSGTDATASTSTSSSGSVAAMSPAGTIRHAEPKQAVEVFLEALKSGDQDRSTAMLTAKAQTEMAKTEAAIRPPGSPTARFEVTEVEYLGENNEAAQVHSIWDDAEADGTPTRHEIVWILRQESSGWAIAGFATQVFPDQPPLILNFENPLDLQQKRNAVDAEIARRQDSTITQ